MTAHEGAVDPSVILIAASAVGVTTIIVAFLGCMWCRNKWKRLTQRHYQLSECNRGTSIPPPQNLTEFTIFPPPSSNQFSLPTGISPDEVVFEPLPEIRSRMLASTSENIRPARFTGSCEKISLQDWFDEYQINFPRNHLKYFREVGPTWYGQAVEGEACNIKESEETTKVVVKILRVDATSTELMQYLQETRPFRDLQHPNLLTLLNRCLEVHPFLLIMEHCVMDLKSYLIEQRKSPETLLKNGILLRMACNLTSALQYMHERGYIHMDVAAHNCLVTSDGIVKLGDYGTAVHLHKADFYCLGDVAFPIRWCAPETLMCTESVIEAKDITREANIWSFGVVLWELLEFGKLPYVNMNDNDVIQKVLIECTVKLEQPKTPCVHKDMIYKIMQFCWLPASLRPTIQKVSTLLSYLYDNRDVVSECATFESRWNTLQPVIREHNLQNAPPHISLRFESDFMPKRENDLSIDCDSMMSSEFDPGAYGDKSPSSSSFSMGYEGELAPDISPSLLNLRGSVEDLIVDDEMNGEQSNSACTSEPLSLETLPAGSETSDTDAIQLRITEAIQDLDTILAEEVTSSENSHCNTPEKKPEGLIKLLDAASEVNKSNAENSEKSCILTLDSEQVNVPQSTDELHKNTVEDIKINVAETT
ncbi:serine/threonine-protein kinase LMTK1-like [Argiope bruennichi]|uniref:Serine/threonine-protein kinase LMTK1 like protein n=1 Tax=Argiope bruennichi TaxID=94029 RepID=A0A8T0E356_ARGBR|nr:serine/threonine-protein kinase LMTK1-like [Argiope bruennichi]KAF8765248.1 Serine/threonine-protein kinase LMTK1 like protein [Argiope bruennichi]